MHTSLSGSTTADCQLCQLNAYFSGFQISAQTCNEPDIYVNAKDVVGHFCNADVADVADDEVYSELCTTACLHPWDQFDTNAWMSQWGSFAAGPFAGDYNCEQYCGGDLPVWKCQLTGSVWDCWHVLHGNVPRP
jgi:hypothetical protein